MKKTKKKLSNGFDVWLRDYKAKPDCVMREETRMHKVGDRVLCAESMPWERVLVTARYTVRAQGWWRMSMSLNQEHI